VVRTWGALYILTSKCASRHNNVHFLNISTIYMSAEPDVCPEPTPVAQNGYFFNGPRRSLRRVVAAASYWETTNVAFCRVIPLFYPFTSWFLGGGRFRPFLPIVLELFYPLHIFLVVADLDPLCMSFWRANPLLLTFYVRLEEGGRFIPCVCVYRSNPLLYLSTYCFRGVAKFYMLLCYLHRSWREMWKWW